MYNFDVFDRKGVTEVAAESLNNAGTDYTVDQKSKQRAYSLFESNFLANIEVGTVKGLKEIHSYLFGGL